MRGARDRIRGEGRVESKVDATDCESEEATHRVAEVVIDPFDCPQGTGRLMRSGPDNATFCIEPLGE